MGKHTQFNLFFLLMDMDIFSHLDIAALLITHQTNVNATDRWGFTPLHEVCYLFFQFE